MIGGKIIKFDQSASRSHREKMETNIAVMSRMSEEEKQHIEVLLTCCRRQTAEYDCDKQGWEDWSVTDNITRPG